MLVDRNIRTPGAGKTMPGIGKPENSQLYDNYYSRLIKLIPSEVIAFYMALDAIASGMPQRNVLLWVVFGISLAGTWFYLGRLANVTSIIQRLLTVIALAIWIFTFGGPFEQLSWYNEDYGKLLLVVYTFFIPMVFKGNYEL